MSAFVAGGSLLAAYFLAGRAVPRTVLLLWVPLLWVGLGVWRRGRRGVVPIGMRAVIVLGAGEDARRAAEALASGRITGHALSRGARTPLRSTWGRQRRASSRPTGPRTGATLVSLLELSLEHEFDLWILPGVADIVATAS